MKKIAAVLAFVAVILTAIIAGLPLLSGATPEPDPEPTREQRIMLAMRAASDDGTLVMPAPPDCTEGQSTMSVWAVRLDDTCERLTIIGMCGTDYADPVLAETVATYDCARMLEGASVHRLPLSEVYPYCMVGEVMRTPSEWEPAGWDPGEPAICCQPGCACKPGGTCAHIAVGGMYGYDCGELRKLFPAANCQ